MRGLTKPTLSYFSKDKFSSGTFVKIPLRKGSTLAIVKSSFDARQIKDDIKKSSFSLKKLTAVKEASGLSPAFMQAVRQTAHFYATSEGSVLGAVLPKKFLASPKLLKQTTNKTQVCGEVGLVQLVDEERFREYRGIIREAFARRQSVLFITPTKEEALRAKSLLSTGIERYVYTENEMLKALEDKHPILLITLPSLIAFDRRDLKIIIVERENSRAYQTMSRPFLSTKTFIEYYALNKGLTLILGDSLLSLESLWRERNGQFSEFSPLTWRIKHETPAEIVNMRESKTFEILSPRLRNFINETLDKNKRIFLFGVRRGLAPSTVCSDCGSILLCKNCHAPMVLHSPPLYVCHHCGAKRTAETKCDTCGGWRLMPLGIGTERIFEECKKLYKDTPIFLVDKESAPTRAKAKAIIKQFQASKRGILVGTELSLPYLEMVDRVGVVSLDSLFSIPDFSINERIFYLLTHLRSLAKEAFLIQSRNVGSEVLEQAMRGNILDFYRAEIAEREEIAYPPFSIFIKVIFEGTPDKVKKQSIYLQSLFIENKPHFILNQRAKHGKQILSMILRAPRESWPNAEICRKLLLLTPDFLIKVDPESII